MQGETIRDESVAKRLLDALKTGEWLSAIVSARDDALTRACGVGADLTKVGRHGAPSKRHVCLSEDGMQLVWLSKRKGGMQSSESQRPPNPNPPKARA